MGFLLSLENNLFLKTANSYDFNEYEKDVVLTFLNEYFLNFIKDGNGSYLGELNLNKIKFKWDFQAGKKSLYSDSYSFGMFSPFFYNTIFLKPNFSVESFYNYINNNNFFNLNKLKSPWDFINIESHLSYYKSDNFFIVISNKSISSLKLSNILGGSPFYINKIWCKDFFKFKTLEYFIDSTSNPLLTLCHELYHKWQFTASPIMPIIFICNSLLSMFFNYEYTQKYGLFLEGDVSKYIDNDENKKNLTYFEKSLNYISALAKIYMFQEFLKDDFMIKESTEMYTIYGPQNNEFYKNNFFHYQATFLLAFIKTYGYNKLLINENIKKYIEETIPNFSINFYENKKINKDSIYFQILFNIMKKHQILEEDFIKFIEEVS